MSIFSSLISKIPGIQYAKTVIICSIIVVLVGGYFYIQAIDAKLALEQQNNATLTSSIAEQKTLIDTMQKDVQTIKGYYQQFQTIQSEQRRAIQTLQDKFNQSSSGKSRSLGELAIEKPKLIENVINEGTSKVNRCFEIITGSPLKDGEKYEDCK